MRPVDEERAEHEETGVLVEWHCGMGEDVSHNSGAGLHYEGLLNRKMKAEVRALVEALERCLKTQSDFEAVNKLNDKLRKQIAELKTSDEQREKILRLTDEIKERGREAAELRTEQEALKKINRDQKRWKQWDQNVSVEDTKRIADLQATANDLKTTINELKEKKHRVEAKLKEKESVAEALEHKYKALMALVTKAEVSGGSRIESQGPLPRGEMEYLHKHLATLQHCKEVDEKNHAALLQRALKQLRDNKNRVAQQQNLLQSKEEEIRQNNELLKTLKAQNRMFPNALPPIQNEEKQKKDRKKGKNPQRPAPTTQGAGNSSSSTSKPGLIHDNFTNAEVKDDPDNTGNTTNGSIPVANKSASQPALRRDLRGGKGAALGQGKGACKGGKQNRKGAGYLQRGESERVPLRKGQSSKTQSEKKIPRPPEKPHEGQVRGYGRRTKPLDVPNAVSGKSNTEENARQIAQNYVTGLTGVSGDSTSECKSVGTQEGANIINDEAPP